MRYLPTKGPALLTLVSTLLLAGCSGGSSEPVTPPAATVTTVSVTAPNASLAAGSTMQLTATARDANGNAMPGAVITWSSSNNGVATVSNSGLVTGVVAGTVTISATSEGKTGQVALTVTAAGNVLSVSLAGNGIGAVASTPAGIACSTPSSGCNASFAPGTSVALAATPAAGSAFAGWSGACTGTGACTVTLDQARTVTATFTLVTVVSIAVSPSSLTLVVGGATGSLTASVVNSAGPVTSPSVTWTSSNPAAATVTGSGATATVTAVANGSTTITATSGGVSGTATITVTAAPLPVVSVVASDATAAETGPDVGIFTVSRAGATTSALVVNLTISGTATNGTDYTPVGSTVTLPAGQASATVQVTPLADALTEGQETVVLTLAAGNYSVGSPSAATVTIIDATPEPPGTLINGRNHTGTIATAGEIDTWTFDANQGDFIALSIAEVGANSPFIPWIRLERPDGTQIGQGFGDLVGQISLNAPTTGTYRVRVASGDAGGTRTGAYQITLARAPGTPVVPAGDEGGALTNGGNHAGKIHPGDIDQWTFTAAQGEFIVLSAGDVSTTSPFTPWIRLIRPDGTMIGQGFGNHVGQIALNAPTTGTYTVIVSSGDTGADDPGDYTLTLAKAPGTVTIPPNDEGGPMTNGANHTGHIFVGDVDQWTFAANQGDFIVLSASDVSTTSPFVPWIRLVRPDGTMISQGFGNNVGQVSLNAPTTGTYTVIVSSGDTGADDAGDYILTLAKAPGTFTVPANDEGGAMTNGANHTGRIAMGDLDQWTFTASQGEFIVVSAADVSTTSPFVPWIRLIRPDGTMIAQGFGNNVGQVALNAPSTGTYTVVVSSGDTGADDPGDYVLTLAKAPGTFTVPANDEGGAMTNGANHTGRIGMGDVDQWTFTASQGEFIVVSAADVSTTSSFVPWIRLIRPDGTMIAQGFGNNVGQVALNAPNTGTYTVVVSAGDTGADDPGDYVITLAKAPGSSTVPANDEGGAMTNGANHTGRITMGDVDQWTFTANQGEFIALAVADASTTSPFVPWIRLVRPDGTLIGQGFGDLAGHIALNAPTTGTYTVIVSSGDTGADDPGDYQLTLVKAPGQFTISNGDEGGALPIGDTNGRINIGELDVWTFSAVQGASVSLTITETGTNSAFVPWIRVIRPDGTLHSQAFNDQTAQLTVTVPTTGTYYIVVASGDTGSDAAGNYRITRTGGTP